MNKNLKGAVFAFVMVCLALTFLIAYPERYLSRPTTTPTVTTEVTVTPSSTNTFFIARVNIDTPCRSGTSKVFNTIATIPQGRDVMVIGNNGNMNDWLLVRWGSYQDCWIESKFLTLFFDPGLLIGVPTSMLYTNTPVFTPTLVLTIASTSTITLTPKPVVSRTPTQGLGGAGLDSTISPNANATIEINSSTPMIPSTSSLQPNTLQPTSTLPLPSTNTQFPSATNSLIPPPTSTPFPPSTNTPVLSLTSTPFPPPTNTPGNKSCRDGIDNNGNGLIDWPLDPSCRNKNDIED